MPCVRQHWLCTSAPALADKTRPSPDAWCRPVGGMEAAGRQGGGGGRPLCVGQLLQPHVPAAPHHRVRWLASPAICHSLHEIAFMSVQESF